MKVCWNCLCFFKPIGCPVVFLYQKNHWWLASTLSDYQRKPRNCKCPDSRWYLASVINLLCVPFHHLCTGLNNIYRRRGTFVMESARNDSKPLSSLKLKQITIQFTAQKENIFFSWWRWNILLLPNGASNIF